MKSSLPLSLPAVRAVVKLGRDVALARRRRRLTQASLAERAGIARKTLIRLESGHPKVALESLARVLHVLGEVDRLAQLLDTGEDSVGLLLMDEALPLRVRARRTTAAM
jgi:transcriptional regulator with XRE-family HTH domain